MTESRETPFRVSIRVYPTPWNKDKQILHMGIKGFDIPKAERPAANRVFLIDTSGSMADEGKIDKARKALLFGIRTLRDGDRFTVINFAGEEHMMERGLIAANAEGKKRGEELVSNLTPNGGTNSNDSLMPSRKQF